MKNLLSLSVLAGAITLTACSAPEDPQGTVCKQMEEVLTQRSRVDWEPASHTDEGDILRVDLYSPDLNAYCRFYREPDPSDGSELRFKKMPYENVPFEMYINGNKVAEQDMVKASFTATGMQFEKSVRDTDKMLQEGARQAEDAARKAGQEIMDKAKELNR